MSWTDMAQEDKLKETAAQEKKTEESGRTLIEGAARVKREIAKKETGLSREQREEIHFRNVVRKKDFICLERVNDKIVNILNVLELHTRVFSTAEQKRIVDLVYELQEKGKNHELGGVLLEEFANGCDLIFGDVLAQSWVCLVTPLWLKAPDQVLDGPNRICCSDVWCLMVQVSLLLTLDCRTDLGSVFIRLDVVCEDGIGRLLVDSENALDPFISVFVAIE
ncbi:hypothetical protein ZIOFF_071396 [Zingiber officinale]|uniref:Uncharacterized protein n=1 Tax=Zingiber officinale TaxID=94328 RepID=A0A8J5CUN8_ZINOF|nr:hypothetical protein ZIOFF_071396 [Zingiber officinale]